MSIAATAERLRADRAEAQNRCPVGRLRLTLSELDRTELDALMALPYADMPTTVILEAMKESGIDYVSDDSAMQSHRRRMRGGQGCKCQV